jgi:release factor glutamine methyltransferase
MKLKDYISSNLKNSSFDQDFKFLAKEVLNISNTEFESFVLTQEKFKDLESKFNDLKNGKPLAYILNSQPFLDFDFYVDERVLIPRSETEFLVDQVLKLTDPSFKTVLDIGAGSGCIGISYLLKRKNSFCIFIENSLSAIEVLKFNLNKYSILSERYLIFKSFEELDEVLKLRKSKQNKPDLDKIDLVISNPPYISTEDPRLEKSVRLFEPHSALFADEEGLYYLKNWSLQVKKYSIAGRTLGFFEFGEGQHQALKDFAKLNLLKYEILEDQYKVKRFFKVLYES